MRGNGIRNYFRENLIKKITAFVLLLSFHINIFSEIVPDPASLARATKTATGVDQLDISAPNSKGMSYNSLLELQVSEQGLILNNSNQVVVDTQIAGLVARNRNLDNSGTANLIITEIVGKNKTGINGYVEVAGDKADIVIANRNGININGGGFLNTDRVTLTTGKLNISDGELKTIDVSNGQIGIGEGGIDALSLSDLELISKTIDIAGIIKGSKETKLRISTGGQTYEYKTKEVKSKGKTYSGIAVDGKSAGSMYAGKIDIISNDKGAGVNARGDLVSVDDVTITASGEIQTNKVHSEKRVVYKTPKRVKIRKQVTAGEKVVIESKKTEIDVDAKVITGYLKESLGEESFENKSEEININGKIEANGKVQIDADKTSNKGEVVSTGKITVNGTSLDNTDGEIRSTGKIDINTRNTVNRNGYILADGTTKDEADKSDADSGNNSSQIGAPNVEYGVNVSGNLDNTEGVIKGREITVNGRTDNNAGVLESSEGIVLNGNLDSNNKGTIKSNDITFNGSKINNEKGFIQGSLNDINTKTFINDNGVIITDKALNIVSMTASNANGEIYANGDVKVVSEKINNFAGLVSSTGNVDTKSTTFNNEKGDISANSKINIKSTEKLNNKEGNIESGEKVSVETEDLDNRKGNINSSETEIDAKKLNNTEGKITGTDTKVKSDSIDNVRGLIDGISQTTVRTGVLSNKDGKITSEGAVDLETPSDYVYEGTVEGKGLTSIKAKTITINEAMNRSGALELIAQNGITLNDDVVSRILSIQTSSDFTNSTDLKGNEYLSIAADNITNNGKLLSDEMIYAKTDGKLLNTGEINSLGESYLEGLEIENRRGIILSTGSLTMIADSLVRNNSGEIHSDSGIYVQVNNGRFENIGESTVELVENVATANTVNGKSGKTKLPDSFKNVFNAAPAYSMAMDSKDSDITSGGDVVLNVNGDVINRDGGRIVSDGITQIKANNVYNISKTETSRDGNTMLIGAGGEIRGSKVYLEVSGKVVNGVEEYTGNSYRREDGVLVDNRNVFSTDRSAIAGNEETVISTGYLINTAQIGEAGKGYTYIEAGDKVQNHAIGGNVAGIYGEQVAVEGKNGVSNVGSEIEGTEGTQVTSSNGEVINESTVTSERSYRNNALRGGFLKALLLSNRQNPLEVATITESVRNVGKIDSREGLVYVEGDKGIINVAGNIRGATGTYLTSKNGTIQDRTIALRNSGRNVVETRTEYRETTEGKFRNSSKTLTEEEYRAKLSEQEKAKADGNNLAPEKDDIRRYGKNDDYLRNAGKNRTILEEVQVSTNWDIVDRTDTTSGIIGLGGPTVLNAGKDIILESSDLRAKGGDIVLNAKNYLMMLSTVDTEYKTRTTTHSSGGGLRKKKTTTQTWTEDNEYANNVDLSTDDNILMNYHGTGAPADNRGIFAQGVNFNAGGAVSGYSEGNIYEQGTKDRLNREYNSETRKSWIGITYGKSSDYVREDREKYVHSRLYGDAGITFEADGKLRVEGVDIQSRGGVFLKGKLGTDILPGIENGYRYEEHKSSGLTASLGISWSGISAGVGYQRSSVVTG